MTYTYVRYYFELCFRIYKIVSKNEQMIKNINKVIDN